MKTRGISALIGIILFAAVIISPVFVFDIAVLVITQIGLCEILSALKINSQKLLFAVNLLFSAIIILNTIFIKLNFAVIAYIYLIVIMILMVTKHDSNKFAAIASSYTVCIMVSVAFSFLILTRHIENYGLLDVMLIFIGSWITDTCAYFSGVFFGRHKLCPVISPKKTIEGSVGGALGTIIVFAVYGMVVSNTAGIEVNILHIMILGLLCGIVSQIGDLSASVIKREHGIKDYGNIMPGHGGVLDRFDSVLFVAPVVYVYITYCPVFA